MTKTFIKRGLSYYDFEVDNIPEGTTPEEILDFCDPNNFGGDVHQYGTKAYVTVYFD